MRGIARYVDDLLRSHRPRRFRASGEDARVAQTAITLRAARPGSGVPREEFVTELHRSLAAELDPPAPGRAVSRRQMVLRTAGVAAGAAAAGAGIDHGLTARVATPAADSTLTPQTGAWLTVAVSADLPDGAVRPFSTGAISGFLERVDGRARAVSGICTHQGCKLALAGQPARLVCPCHGATFALDGAILAHRLPDRLTPLPRLAVREIDGTVQVYAPAPAQPPSGQP
jgi:nitrite reductase/ring-hydroxylating ferredoxin subunit